MTAELSTKAGTAVVALPFRDTKALPPRIACPADTFNSLSPQPRFQSNEATSQFGQGHNSFTTTPDGIVDLLVYPTRNYRDLENPLGNPDRATRAQQVLWKTDGTPDIGVPVAARLYQVPLSTP